MKRETHAEDSISLRFITSAMAVVGILAACHLAETPPELALFGIFGTAIGSWVSYKRRRSNNFWIKWAIAAGIILVLGGFIEALIYRIQASIADAREPLGNMLVGLQALHSFDLPRRRDLNISALVGLTLLASVSTLSRDIVFGAYLGAFFFFAAYMLYLDCTSRTLEGTANQQADFSASGRRQGSPAVVLISVLPLLVLLTFFLLPRLDLDLMSNIQVSVKLNLPRHASARIINPMLSHFRRKDGSLIVSPLSYFGFNEDLDLNYRGELSNQVVMTVSSPRGELWRSMAFDTYDGHKWSMTTPRKTDSRLASFGSLIYLSPLPSLPVPPSVPVRELRQTFHLDVDQPNLIPAASIPTEIYFPASKVEVDSYGSLRCPVMMEKDMAYTVISQVPIYDLEKLRYAARRSWRQRERIKSAMGNYLQLPAELPNAVRALAKNVAGTGSDFAKAEKLQNFLLSEYRYDLATPPTPADQDVVTDFLYKQRRGSCEQFATTFVVMCRAIDIPARLVTGFHPGQFNPFTGLWEVRMQDAHAWAEIFLPRYGWIAFDPVPDGVPAAFQGLARENGGDYILRHLHKLLQAITRAPAFQYLWRVTSQALAEISKTAMPAVYLALEIWKPLVAIMATVALLALIPGWLGQAPWLKRLFKPPLPNAPPARATLPTREFLKVLSDLQTLAIDRRPQDTAADLSARVHASPISGKAALRNLPALLDDFLAEYSRSRFGRSEETGKLTSLSGKIHERIQGHPHDKPD